ncbi:slipin family protein [Aliikangiella coralliicola]|uniref:Slipin family protein n=1 Tax=Aliikangiella coralliicola TaxID=2592383 RepID=A0A545UIM4_9GAMM|nr:slipin family protein [Aliikangiella coralliicola]TQV89317.1 slipin family protein [Aliikangiella coralliicola]
MLGFTTINVADNERVLLFRNNRLERLLQPGEYHLFNLSANIEIIRYDITKPELNNHLGRFLIKNYYDLLGNEVISYDTKENEVGLVYFDGKLSNVIPPNTFKMFWDVAVKVEVKIIDISEDFHVDKRLLPVLVRNKGTSIYVAGSNSIYYAEIADNHVGLLKVNGKLEKILKPGNYGFWRFNQNIEVGILDCRLQNMDINGQEILTKDRVSLRINLSASYRVIDTEKVAVLLKSHTDFLYREFQLALREVVGTRTLDAILEDKDIVNQIVEKRIKSKAYAYGLSIHDVGVKDIILPGEMKSILNQVVEAQKAAEANLIRRKEETQATRSLHNTAKVMEGNSTLMRLKELEVLERVTGKINQLTVYGGLDSVMNDLIKITEK